MGGIYLAADCLGGGRIQRDQGKILVYGYSQVSFFLIDKAIHIILRKKISMSSIPLCKTFFGNDCWEVEFSQLT